MSSDVFMTRFPTDPQEPSAPRPGPVPGSVELEADDGDARSYNVMDIGALLFNGRSGSVIMTGMDLNGILLVTDSRIVFATKKVPKSELGAKGATYMFHVRYEDLAGVAGTNFNFLKGASYLRLVVPQPEGPDNPGGIYVVTIEPGRAWGGGDLSADIVGRATRRREFLAGAAAAPFVELPLAKSGTGWIGLAPGDRWYESTSKFVIKRGGLLG